MESQTQTQTLPTEKNIRIHHHRLDKDYSILANHGTENPNLSFAAKGLLWYMLSRPTDFQIHTWHLASVFEGKKRGNGIDGIRIMLKELESEGYLTHARYRDEQGQWAFRYDIYPMPPKDFQKVVTSTVKPDGAEPDGVKPDVLTSTELPITDLPITESNIIEEPDPIPIKSRSPSVPIVSATPIPAEGSIPLHKEEKGQELDLNSDDLLELLSMEDQYTPFLRANVTAGWIKKFGHALVLATIKFFLKTKQTQKKPIENPEAWMEIALAKKFAESSENSFQNKKFAEAVKKSYKISTLKINKRYCEDTETGRDFYYTLPIETFKRGIVQCFQWARMKN